MSYKHIVCPEDPDLAIDLYIYDYLIRFGSPQAAQLLLSEKNLNITQEDKEKLASRFGSLIKDFFEPFFLYYTELARQEEGSTRNVTQQDPIKIFLEACNKFYSGSDIAPSTVKRQKSSNSPSSNISPDLKDIKTDGPLRPNGNKSGKKKIPITSSAKSVVQNILPNKVQHGQRNIYPHPAHPLPNSALQGANWDTVSGTNNIFLSNSINTPNQQSRHNIGAGDQFQSYNQQQNTAQVNSQQQYVAQQHAMHRHTYNKAVRNTNQGPPMLVQNPNQMLPNGHNNMIANPNHQSGMVLNNGSMVPNNGNTVPVPGGINAPNVLKRQHSTTGESVANEEENPIEPQIFRGHHEVVQLLKNQNNIRQQLLVNNERTFAIGMNGNNRIGNAGIQQLQIQNVLPNNINNNPISFPDVSQNGNLANTSPPNNLHNKLNGFSGTPFTNSNGADNVQNTGDINSILSITLPTTTEEILDLDKYIDFSFLPDYELDNTKVNNPQQSSSQVDNAGISAHTDEQQTIDELLNLPTC